MAHNKALSLREQEVLMLISKGFTTREIARSIHRSFNTVAMHRQHILKKLGVRTTVAALQLAMEGHMLPLKKD
jgi:DNA-binding NarL/FixJ family response regulator